MTFLGRRRMNLTLDGFRPWFNCSQLPTQRVTPFHLLGIDGRWLERRCLVVLLSLMSVACQEEAQRHWDPELREKLVETTLPASKSWQIWFRWFREAPLLSPQDLRLDRSDFERAGLVQQKLERTNSMRVLEWDECFKGVRRTSVQGSKLVLQWWGDINLDSALAILSRGAGQQRDPLAAREGGCQLQLLATNVNSFHSLYDYIYSIHHTITTSSKI